MYTWGYIKENVLSKLNLSEEAANQQGFLSRFPYLANEAMTQICSSIKPKETFFIIEVLDKEQAWKNLTNEFNIYVGQHIQSEEDVEDSEFNKAFWEKWRSLHFTYEPITLPDDFISFCDDKIEYKGYYDSVFSEVGDEKLQYYGYNQIICKDIGIYKVPYNARWFFFTKDLENNFVLPVPADILDAITSYIVSQCFKIDDEAKSAIYRNEYEMFLARIDDTTFKSQRTLTISGGW